MAFVLSVLSHVTDVFSKNLKAKKKKNLKATLFAHQILYLITFQNDLKNQSQRNSRLQKGKPRILSTKLNIMNMMFFNCF